MAGMFPELGERSELTSREVSDYRRIRPENGMTTEEARQLWDGYFEKLGGENGKEVKPQREIIDGKMNYYDDRGTLYRIENDLLPDNNYELNGYRYETDECGRIASVEGCLHMKDREGRLPIRDSIEDIGKGDQREGDDRGHLIGDQFDGANGLENMIPQDAGINRYDYKNFENELASKVRDGEAVQVEIEVVYEDGSSRRPTDVIVVYSVDGTEDMRIFPNGEES